LLQPGTPFIYYGEEVGQAGAVGPGMVGDLPIRSPMSWTAEAPGAGFTSGQPFRPLAPNRAQQNAQAQAADPGSILNFYKAVLKLRNQHPSIARGRFEHSFAQGLSLGFQRAWGDERTLVLIHYGTTPAEVAVPNLPAGAVLEPLMQAVLGAQAAAAASAVAPTTPTRLLTLPAQSVQVFRVNDRVKR
jgi:glycosidase